MQMGEQIQKVSGLFSIRKAAQRLLLTRTSFCFCVLFSMKDAAGGVE